MQITIDLPTSELRDLIDEVITEADYVTRDAIEGIVTEDALEAKLDDYVRSDDVDDRVQDVLNGSDYITSYDVDDKIRDAVEGLGGVSEDDLAEVEARIDARIDRVANSLEKRLESRIEALELERDNVSGTLAQRVQALEARLAVAEERNKTALTFFDLIQQAFALLQRR